MDNTRFAVKQMGQIAIDYQVVDQTCNHCRATFQVTRGSAYDDNIGFGLYLTALHACHSGRVAHLVVAVRKGYQTFRETCAVAMQITATETDFQMSVVNAEDFPWASESYLGRIMDREEALESPLIQIFFRFADQVVDDNPKIREYFSATT